MNRNTRLLAFIVGGSFMFLSFVLRLFFFTNYTSLIIQPLLMFIGWFILTAGILFFLENDFNDIYKLFIFFEENKNNSKEKKHNKSQYSASSKKLNIKDDGIEDYFDIFDKHTPEQISSSRSSMEADLKVARKPNSSQKNYSHGDNTVLESLSKSKPKQLANVVKKFLHQDENNL